VCGAADQLSLGVDTYTVYVQPFYDEVNRGSLGTLSIFNDPNATVYTISGTTYVGTPGLSALSQTSAGSTLTAAYTTYKPTPTLNASVTAGKFTSTYVVAGATLEDYYTSGLEGDVIARSGNTLTVRGATLEYLYGTASPSTGYNSAYINTPDAVVLVGPGTIVTADDNATLKGLDYIRCPWASTSSPAASTRCRHPASPRWMQRERQHQHRIGAPRADAALGFVGLVGIGQRGTESANHRELAGEYLQLHRRWCGRHDAGQLRREHR